MIMTVFPDVFFMVKSKSRSPPYIVIMFKYGLSSQPSILTMSDEATVKSRWMTQRTRCISLILYWDWILLMC